MSIKPAYHAHSYSELLPQDLHEDVLLDGELSLLGDALLGKILQVGHGLGSRGRRVRGPEVRHHVHLEQVRSRRLSEQIRDGIAQVRGELLLPDLSTHGERGALTKPS